MKKVFYSIGIVSAMLFSACSEDRGTTTEVADSNEDEYVDPSNLQEYDQPGTAASKASTDATIASYEQDAKAISDQMAKDLQLDEATATEVTRIYQRRSSKTGSTQGTTFSSTEQMGGSTNETKDMKAGSETSTTGTTSTTSAGNRSEMDAATDRELKAVLTPEQYRKYEQNRAKYNSMQKSTTGTSSATKRPTTDNQ